MKVSNVSIFKDVTAVEAIHLAIAEMFNERASAEFMDCLVIDGFVGTCEEVTEYGEYISYFLVSDLPAGFKRVEYCSHRK